MITTIFEENFKKFFSSDDRASRRSGADKLGPGFFYNNQEFVPHNSLAREESAFFRLLRSQQIYAAASLTVLVICFALNWHATLEILVTLLTVLYFVDLIFNCFLVYRSFQKAPEIKITTAALVKVPKSAWPAYTIFCPLYKEWGVLPQFVKAIRSLDYPKEKLQVLLLLEEDDTLTIEQAQQLELPSYFQVIIVPHSLPKTKPKAMNFGLKLVRGDYLVVYDAEDVPYPQQLKKAVLAFGKLDRQTICVQAKLNYYNPRQNLLTRIFTAEYSLWFDMVLPGLQSLGAPIPLGGTSNHFRVADLKSLEGWDAFNVTEDCDLGIRLAKKGYRTAIMDSTTWEEANSNFANWFSQRSRWVKGYIQTYFVHTRKSSLPSGNWKKRFYFLSFQLTVGGKILSLFINPVMWLITIIYFAFRSHVGAFIESFFPSPVLYMGVFALVFGNFLYIYCYMVGCAKRGFYDLIKYAYLVPFYWLAMSGAAWKAAYEVIAKPHYWAKTTHGLHLKKVLQTAPTFLPNQVS